MIRTAVPADLPAILEIYRPYILHTAYTFEYDVPSPEAFEARFCSITEEYPWLVWEENGDILGYAYGSRAFERAAYAWDADISIYLRQDCRGRGIGRQLYAAVEAILAAQGYFVVYALVTSANNASCAFHEAVGYREAARFSDTGWKFGQWHDIIWYEKRLKHGTPEQPPVSWRTLDLNHYLSFREE